MPRLSLLHRLRLLVGLLALALAACPGGSDGTTGPDAGGFDAGGGDAGGQQPARLRITPDPLPPIRPGTPIGVQVIVTDAFLQILRGVEVEVMPEAGSEAFVRPLIGRQTSGFDGVANFAIEALGTDAAEWKLVVSVPSAPAVTPRVIEGRTEPPGVPSENNRYLIRIGGPSGQGGAISLHLFHDRPAPCGQLPDTPVELRPSAILRNVDPLGGPEPGVVEHRPPEGATLQGVVGVTDVGGQIIAVGCTNTVTQPNLANPGETWLLINSVFPAFNGRYAWTARLGGVSQGYLDAAILAFRQGIERFGSYVVDPFNDEPAWRDAPSSVRILVSQWLDARVPALSTGGAHAFDVAAAAWIPRVSLHGHLESDGALRDGGISFESLQTVSFLVDDLVIDGSGDEPARTYPALAQGPWVQDLRIGVRGDRIEYTLRLVEQRAEVVSAIADDVFAFGTAAWFGEPFEDDRALFDLLMDCEAMALHVERFGEEEVTRVRGVCERQRDAVHARFARGIRHPPGDRSFDLFGINRLGVDNNCGLTWANTLNARIERIEPGCTIEFQHRDGATFDRALPMPATFEARFLGPLDASPAP